MGKKGRRCKTRWRRLPMESHSGEEEERLGGRSKAGEGGTSSKGKAVGRRCAVTDKKGPAAAFNEDEYTKITTPRQDVLFKKGYLMARKKDTEATNGDTAAPLNGDASSSSDQTFSAQVSGSGEDDNGGCNGYAYVNGYSNGFSYGGGYHVDNGGTYFVNGGSYEMYDPYAGYAFPYVGAPPTHTIPPLHAMDWYGSRPAVGDVQWCHLVANPGYSETRRKRYSTDSQNCSPPSSESTGPPGSPQEESGDHNHQPQYHHAHVFHPPAAAYVYPGYLFGPAVYSVNGYPAVHPGISQSIHVHPSAATVPPAAPASDGGSQRRRKKKRRRKRRRGLTDEASEETSSEAGEGGEEDGGTVVVVRLGNVVNPPYAEGGSTDCSEMSGQSSSGAEESVPVGEETKEMSPPEMKEQREEKQPSEEKDSNPVSNLIAEPLESQMEKKIQVESLATPLLPEKKEDSLEKKEDLPEKKEDSLEKKEDLPEKKEESFEKKEVSLEKKEVSLDKIENLPEKKENLPEKKENLPEKIENLPEKKENLPEKKEKDLEKIENLPEKKEKDLEKKEDLLYSAPKIITAEPPKTLDSFTLKPEPYNHPMLKKEEAILSEDNTVPKEVNGERTNAEEVASKHLEEMPKTRTRLKEPPEKATNEVISLEAEDLPEEEVVEPADVEDSEMPSETLTEVVSKWLEENSDALPETTEEIMEKTEEETGSKNGVGNPFPVPSSRLSANECVIERECVSNVLNRDGPVKRVANRKIGNEKRSEEEEKRKSMCDPNTSVAKYYCLGSRETDSGVQSEAEEDSVAEEAFEGKQRGVGLGKTAAFVVRQIGTSDAAKGPFPCGICCIIQ